MLLQFMFCMAWHTRPPALHLHEMQDQSQVKASSIRGYSVSSTCISVSLCRRKHQHTTATTTTSNLIGASTMLQSVQQDKSYKLVCYLVLCWTMVVAVVIVTCYSSHILKLMLVGNICVKYAFAHMIFLQKITPTANALLTIYSTKACFHFDLLQFLAK